MKKILTAVILTVLTLSLVFSISSNVFAKEDLLLFDKTGDYIRKDPFVDIPTQSWLLVGKNVIENSSDKQYPIVIKNSTKENSTYYVAGSNSLDWLANKPEYIDYLKNDFVFEYEIDYETDSNGHISLVLAYNYSYYVDAYVDSNGLGDIKIVADKSETSYIKEESILSPTSNTELINAIFGKGKGAVMRDKMMVSVRVSVNENKMPSKLYMYLNGCLVAETNDEFTNKVNELTPVYEMVAGNKFPENTLGNMVAIMATESAHGSIGGVSVYPVDNENFTPNGSCGLYYKDTYGNASYNPDDFSSIEDTTTPPDSSETESSTEGDSVSETVSSDVIDDTVSETENESYIEDTVSEENTTKRRVDIDDEEDTQSMDVVRTLCLVLGVASVFMIVLALVILKIRTNKK